MKRKPGPSGCAATRTAAAPIITSTISTLARVAAGGMRSNDNRAATYPAKASVTARPFPVKPGPGRARNVTAYEKAEGHHCQGQRPPERGRHADAPFRRAGAGWWPWGP